MTIRAVAFVETLSTCGIHIFLFNFIVFKIKKNEDVIEYYREKKKTSMRAAGFIHQLFTDVYRSLFVERGETRLNGNFFSFLVGFKIKIKFIPSACHLASGCVLNFNDFIIFSYSFKNQAFFFF